MKRVAHKAARGFRHARSSGSSWSKENERNYVNSDSFARMISATGRDISVEEARKRALFFVDFGYTPDQSEDIDAIRAKHEKAQAEAKDLVENRRPIYQPEPPPMPPPREFVTQTSGHSCSHHCFHTYPGQYGGSRSDTYDPTLCCHCGASAPNPYDNERR
jgi:hypothetical protein